MTDQLKKYLFEDRTVRVQAVRLSDTWRDAQAHHAYTPAVRRLLGELIAASALLAANIKFDGSLLLQIQGDGPISLVVVECKMEPPRSPSSLSTSRPACRSDSPGTAQSAGTVPCPDSSPEGDASGLGRPGAAGDLSLRATVKVREGQTVPEDGTLQSLLNAHGAGRFMVLLDPKRKTPGQQAYQGIVPLEGETVAQVLEHYMKSSEQLDTRMWLAADGQNAAGFLVQRLPDQGGRSGAMADAAEADTAAVDTDAWNRATQLAGTLGAGELLATDIDTLIHRLYWEETLLVFDPQDVRWHCPCGRGRVAEMLRMLGRAEVESILAEQGQVEVSCDFCGKPYLFDAVDCAGLFASGAPLADTQHPPTMH